MNDSKNDKSRPVIIQSLQNLLSKQERAEIKRIAKEMRPHLDALDNLTNQYRDLVGYENCELEFTDQFDYEPNETSLLEVALDARKEWAMKELNPGLE